MHTLAYAVILLAALGVAAAAYFGLAFGPAEALAIATAFGCLAVLLVERQIRERAERRFDKAIDELSRVMAGEAQAGATLRQRLDSFTDIRAEARLAAAESEIAALRARTRQLTERLEAMGEEGADTEVAVVAPSQAVRAAEPVIPLEMLRQAVDEGRIVFHIRPIIALPERRAFAYDLVPRIALEEGDFAEPADFMPRQGGEEVVARLEADGIDEAVVIARRARTAGAPILLNVPVSRATLGSPKAVEAVMAALEASRAVSSSLHFSIAQAGLDALGPKERAALAGIGQLGVGLTLVETDTLNVDQADLQGMGFRIVCVDAARFLADPHAFSSLPPRDVAAHARRHGIEIAGTGVTVEEQLRGLFEHRVTLAQGPFIAGPGPVRADLRLDRDMKPSAQA